MHFTFYYFQLVLWPFLLQLIIPKNYTGAVATVSALKLFSTPLIFVKAMDLSWLYLLHVLTEVWSFNQFHDISILCTDYNGDISAGLQMHN